MCKPNVKNRKNGIGMHMYVHVMDKYIWRKMLRPLVNLGKYRTYLYYSTISL